MFEIDRSLAIIIGINEYQHIPQLKNAVADAIGLADVLQNIYGYKVLLLLNQRATKAELDKLLKSLKNKTIAFDNKLIQVGKSDRVLFYFAGHGFAEAAQDSEVGKPAGYFMPQDAEANKKHTWLSMQKLYEAFSALDSHHLLMILDCCFAGRVSWIGQGRNAARSGKLFRQSYDRFIKHKTEQIITSAAHDEEAQDISRFGQRGEQNGNSPFAHLLLKVLQCQSDGGKDKSIEAIIEDKIITVHELFTYLQNQLGQVAAGQTPGLSQPRKYDPETGEYVYLKGEYIFPLPKFNPEKLNQLKLNKNTNPYKGLASFDTKDSDLFFGRTILSQQLADKVTEQPLTIVLGASGSGKSSLVKAGLIPILTEDWHILDPMRPGGSPFKELNKILSQSESASSIINRNLEEQVKIISGKISYLINRYSQSKLLLTIDQAEELQTLCRNEERKDFLNLLVKSLNECPQLRIVLTLRSDFEFQIKDVVDEPHWQEVWQQGRFIVTPMNREELQLAIEEPAVQRTLFFESPKLVNQIIDEAIDRTGILPLLSFTLSELYLKYLHAEENGERSDRTITEADYLDLGGVEGSLAQAAKRTYRELVKRKNNPSTIQNVMLRMVSLDGSEITRRRVPKSELDYPEPINEKVDEIIDCFVAARLFTTGTDAEGQEYVEPVHDALVTKWEKLISKSETQENLLLQRRLTPAAQEWYQNYQKWNDLNVNLKSSDRTNKIKAVINWLRSLKRRSPNEPEYSLEKPEKYLWNASPYLDVLNQEVLNSSKSKNNWLNQVETKFVQHSVERKRRNIQARRGIALSVILGLSILTITALIGQRNAQISQIQALIESSDALFDTKQEFDALLDSLRAAKTLDKSVLLKLFPPKLLSENHEPIKAQIAQILQQAVYEVKEYNRLEGDVNTENEGGIVEWSRNLISWSPNGEILAFATKNNTVKLWQPNSDRQPKIIEDKSDTEAPIIGVSWSRDGILATVRQDGTVVLWNQDGDRQNTFKVSISEGNKIYGVSWSPNGQFLAFPAQDRNVYLQKRNGSPLNPLTGQGIAVFGVSWSGDGILASAAGDKTVKLWKPGKSQPIKIAGHPNWVIGVSWSYDSRILASASDNKVMLWDRNGNSYTDPLEHPENVESLSWSRDGILASGSQDGTIRLWKSDGTLLDTLKARGLVQSLSWSPDGKLLASESKNGTVQLWKVNNSLLITLAGHSEAVNSVSWNHDGELLASGSDDNTIRLWNKYGVPYTTLDSNGHNVNSVNWSRDGILASAEFDSVQLWARNGKHFDSKILDHYEYKAPHYQRYQTPVNSVSWSSDGQVLATASNGARVQLWNHNGNPQKDSEDLNHRDWLYDVSWSRNRLLASASKDGYIKILKQDGALPKEFYGGGGEVWSVNWSPNGQILASAQEDSSIRLWDANDKFKLLSQQKGHEGKVFSVNWSPNGKFLATASSDSTVKLWKLDNNIAKKSLIPITTFKGHGSAVNEVSWSPDGKSLATASKDKTVKLWRLDVNLEDEEQFFQDLLVKGCNWMRPYLENNPDLDLESSDRTLCKGVPELKQVASQSSTTLAPEDFSPALKAIAEDYYRRGTEAADRKYLENFTNIIKQSFNDAKKAEAYINRGVIYFRQKEYNLAIEDYDRAIEFDSKNIDVYINRGITYSSQEQHQQAIEDYNKAIALNNLNVDAYISRGIAYSAQREHDKAVQDYNQAIAIAPDNADAHYAKGFTLSLQKSNKQKAIKAYQIAAELYQQQGKNSYLQSAQNQIEQLKQNQSF